MARQRKQFFRISRGHSMVLRTQTVRNCFLAILSIGSLGLLLGWYLSRDVLPRKIRIAAGSPTGINYRIGTMLQPWIEARTGRPVELIVTHGTLENRELLLNGRAELAILQEGAVHFTKVASIAPMYHDYIHVIVRRELGLKSIAELRGKRVVIGLPKSGMRATALLLLAHYGLQESDLRESPGYFSDMGKDSTIEAAIITTGFLNDDLREILIRPEFELLPIHDAEALTIIHPFFSIANIPTGMFSGEPAVPPAAVPTLRTTSLLACRDDASRVFVNAVLTALYEELGRTPTATLIPYQVARDSAHAMTLPGLHADARRFYDPYEGLGIASEMLQSLSAVKELLLAIGALLFLIWQQWKRIREREELQIIAVLKDRLDSFLDETLRLERRQLEARDYAELQQCLDDVTRVKVHALEELTHEVLRGDRLFSIFQVQCSDLAIKIQGKMTALTLKTGLVLAGDSAKPHPPAQETISSAEQEKLAAADLAAAEKEPIAAPGPGSDSAPAPEPPGTK